MKNSLFLCLIFSLAVFAIAMTPSDSTSVDTIQSEVVSFEESPAFEPEIVYICKDTVIQTPNGCARIGCQKQQGVCNDCCIAWKDKNGNGRINKDEIRCMCKDTQTQAGCQLRRQQVDCPNGNGNKGNKKTDKKGKGIKNR